MPLLSSLGDDALLGVLSFVPVRDCDRASAASLVLRELATSQALARTRGSGEYALRDRGAVHALATAFGTRPWAMDEDPRYGWRMRRSHGSSRSPSTYPRVKPWRNAIFAKALGGRLPHRHCLRALQTPPPAWRLLVLSWNTSFRSDSDSSPSDLGLALVLQVASRTGLSKHWTLSSKTQRRTHGGCFSTRAVGRHGLGL